MLQVHWDNRTQKMHRSIKEQEQEQEKRERARAEKEEEHTLTGGTRNYVASAESRRNYLLSCLRLKQSKAKPSPSPSSLPVCAVCCLPCRHNSLPHLPLLYPAILRHCKSPSSSSPSPSPLPTVGNILTSSFPPLLCFINFVVAAAAVLLLPLLLPAFFFGFVALGYALPVLRPRFFRLPSQQCVCV